MCILFRQRFSLQAQVWYFGEKCGYNGGYAVFGGKTLFYFVETLILGQWVSMDLVQFVLGSPVNSFNRVLK